MDGFKYHGEHTVSIYKYIQKEFRFSNLAPNYDDVLCISNIPIWKQYETNFEDLHRNAI